jgi:TetR/AcrR family transcriptional repressor of nem operon
VAISEKETDWFLLASDSSQWAIDAPFPLNCRNFSPAATRKDMNKGELTRQKIIAKAAPIFNQRGYAGCSMQDIQSATGLGKGGLYRHFSSKEELAIESFRYAWKSAVKIRTGDLDNITGAVEQLRYIIQRFAERPSAMPGGCPLMNTAIEADDGNPALRQLARKAIRDWQSRLCGIVELGIREGEIRKAVSARRVANTIIATLEGALMISRLEGSKDAMRDAQASLEILLVEITPERRRPAIPVSKTSR